MPDSGVLTCLLPSITPPSHLSCSCCNSEPRRDASLLIVGNSMSCNMYAKFLIALIRGDSIWGESIQGPHSSKQRMSNPKPVSSLVYQLSAWFWVLLPQRASRPSRYDSTTSRLSLYDILFPARRPYKPSFPQSSRYSSRLAQEFLRDKFGDDSSCPNVHGWNAR